MKAVQIMEPGSVHVADIPGLTQAPTGHVLLRVDYVGMCGTDLSTYRGRNPLVGYPRILGHEVAATVVENGGDLAAGVRVTLSPYSHCGQCASCRRGRYNACQNNQTMGVQRDGAMCEYLAVPRERLYTASLASRELCLVEPLTVGAHAVARGRVTAEDVVA
ncbi:MAG TPA: alcohol dehydrogenase catalytic domain-containing protein, partial [Acidobacteriaceae bacterium]|nr:alcohol dehydrogenase catalytic domain-containing protein [Acidobacteriaceae bacterium]